LKRRVGFAGAFLGVPSSELFGAFALGLLVAGIAGNLVYDLLTGRSFRSIEFVAPVLAMALFTGLAYLLYGLAYRLPKVGLVIDEGGSPAAHAGIIWLFGPGSYDHLLFALQHHRDGGGGVHCWLVMQNIVAVKETFGRLAADIAELTPPVSMHPFYIDELDADATYRAVHDILTRESAEEGLQPGQVVSDITGGTKPMTTGMALAALAQDTAIEYVETERDAAGKPIPGTERVVLLDLDFEVSRGEVALDA